MRKSCLGRKVRYTGRYIHLISRIFTPWKVPWAGYYFLLQKYIPCWGRTSVVTLE